MNIFKIYPVGFAANSYIITSDGATCVVVDPAQPCIAEECAKRGLTPKYALLTHCHYDHIGGCGALYDLGCKIICGEDEKDLVFGEDNRAVFHGITIPHFEIYKTLSDGESTELCGIPFTAVATPGHTRGGMCYIAGDTIFSGDTLFCRSVGRTDFSTGSYPALVSSIKKLYALGGDYKVLCGHGEDTTLSAERKFNPYVKE